VDDILVRTPKVIDLMLPVFSHRTVPVLKISLPPEDGITQGFGKLAIFC
jgi:hypothetical protein